MHYKEIETEYFFKEFIQKFWILNNSLSPFYSSEQYALPNGCCTMAFISGSGICVKGPNGSVDLCPGMYFSGQITKRTSISLKPHTKAIMVQVKPWFPIMFTKVPMSELVNRIVSIEDITTNLFYQFKDIDFTNETVVIEALYKSLNSHLKSNNDSSFIRWIFNNLEKGLFSGRSISDIAASSGFTQRRVEQKFKSLIGPTAKEIQCILQLRRLIDDLQNLKSHDTLSTLAVSHGYYDQSHFIKAYQQIISDTPLYFDPRDYILPLHGHFVFLQS